MRFIQHLFKNMIVFFVLFGIMSSSCASRQIPVFQSHTALKNMTTTLNQAETIPDSDREFKIKDFDKDTYNDKIGYVILGIAGAAITVAGIIIPLMLLNK